ncbi:hypothetical protein VUR80DRAFT_10161 [Thermomyces stellatus]
MPTPAVKALNSLPPADLDFWKRAVVYQIFPASFKDGNDDGFGDIPGIISKLDYIQSLGVDAIWLCPTYDGPQVDMGYDISDFKSVYPRFGTLEDLDRLISVCHERGLRILMDLVISHTSVEHPWFRESRSSKDNPKRDWYIWRPAKYDENGNRQPPNNWKAFFGEASAWNWDSKTEEYYLHMFTEAQADLNWDNPDTRKAICEEAVAFWLERGVDGFRIDAANMYSKPEGLPDAPVLLNDIPYQPVSDVVCNGPHIHEYLGEVADVFRRYGAVSAGEVPFTIEPEKFQEYVTGKDKQLDMVFMFNMVAVGMGFPRKYEVAPHDFGLPEFKSGVRDVEHLMKGSEAWPAMYLESHDQGRSISRFGDDSTPEKRVAWGKLLAMLLTTLSGTLFVYQGQEIGMLNVPSDYPIENITDCESIGYLDFVREKSGNDPEAMKRAEASVRYLSRDNARMPIPWDDHAPHAGFSNAEPHSKMHPASNKINVAAEEADSGSVLAFWRRMIKIRKAQAVLFVFGGYEAVNEEHPDLFIYTKANNGSRALIVLNFSEKQHKWKEALNLQVELNHYHLLESTASGGMGDEDTLNPLEGRIYITT